MFAPGSVGERFCDGGVVGGEAGFNLTGFYSASIILSVWYLFRQGEK